jgi:SNW domain-containing protein 1
VPRSLAAFGDGGAFPEIHVAQYPRNLGNPNIRRSRVGDSGGTAGVTSGSTAIVAVETDADGKTKYDAIVTGGSNADKKVYTSLSAMKANRNDLNVDMPSVEDEAAATERTRAALMGLVDGKIAKSRSSASASVAAATQSTREEDAQYIKYKPDVNAPGYNPNAATRVIKIISAQVDPMEPPKHKHKKVPGGPADDPVPVLHSPPKKLSVEDQNNWKIPPCISNWKNSKGYTIPLDKRMAADGRSIGEATVNNNFAMLSESLYVAERLARDEVRMRESVRKRQGENEKIEREEKLREMAMKARMERGAVAAASAQGGDAGGDSDSDDEDVGTSGGGGGEGGAASGGGAAEDPAAAARDKLRQERKREREREMREEQFKGGKGGGKKARLDDDRDVSEKVALGIHTGNGGAGGAAAVDSRLYNQSAGLSSGFGNDDEYNLYSKPLFDRGAESSIYRPSRGELAVDQDAEYDELKSGSRKGFTGDTGKKKPVVERDGPVQFEKS